MATPARSVVLAAALAAALACASTTLHSVYVAPDHEGGPFERLMVVGLAHSEGGRVLYEKAFVERLAEIGASGIASADVFPSREALSRETVESWVRERGIRGVLVTRLQEVRREQRYVPPEPAWDLYGYYGYWGPAYWGLAPLARPGYVVEERTVVLETSLFDASTGKLVYSAVSETFQPSSREEIVREVVEALTENLQEHGLLPAPAEDQASAGSGPGARDRLEPSPRYPLERARRMG